MLLISIFSFSSNIFNLQEIDIIIADKELNVISLLEMPLVWESLNFSCLVTSYHNPVKKKKRFLNKFSIL